MSESEVDTSRTAVRTYVPSYQRDEWDDHADELGMSRSEYVRTMVQAGRQAFGKEDSDVTADDSDTESSRPGTTEDTIESGTPTGGSASTATGPDLESRVVDVLSGDEYLSWDDVVAAVTDDIEGRIEETLQDLQSDGRVAYSGRNGGYTLTDE